MLWLQNISYPDKYLSEFPSFRNFFQEIERPGDPAISAYWDVTEVTRRPKQLATVGETDRNFDKLLKLLVKDEHLNRLYVHVLLHLRCSVQSRSPHTEVTLQGQILHPESPRNCPTARSVI